MMQTYTNENGSFCKGQGGIGKQKDSLPGEIPL